MCSDFPGREICRDSWNFECACSSELPFPYVLVWKCGMLQRVTIWALAACPPGTRMWACLWLLGQVLGKEGGRGDITCVVLGCHALNSSDLAVPTGVCLSMHRHSRRPLHLPQQCCWSHVTRARFGAAHFFLLGLHCTHPRIIYSTQLQVRFRESVDLAFGVRPLWILVWCVQCVTARRVCIFSLFRVNLCTWRCGLTICENVALEVAFSFVSYLFFCFRLLCACLKGVLLCHYLLFCEIAMCRGKMCYSFGLVCIYWQRGFVLRAVLYPAVVQPYRLNNVCCCWIACTFLAFCHHCVAVCVMF